MSGYSLELSVHLKQLRTSRGLTLNDLAAQSGVSRATLSRIEKAEASPTAETLGSLSSAYGIPISALLAPLETSFNPLVRASEQPIWEDQQHGFIRRNISPPSSALNLELIEGQLAAHQQIHYQQPAIAEQEHHLLLLEGELSLTLENTEYQLTAGDCIRYKLRGASLFKTQHQSARYIIALSKGR